MSPTNHAAVTDPPPDAEIKLLRRFVYGLNYIDELVAQITPATTTDDGGTPTPIPSHVRFVLQDANYNVMGLAREWDAGLIRQYRYEPYGDFERDVSGAVTGVPGTITGVEDGTGTALASTLGLR